jgi:hypothetical protein
VKIAALPIPANIHRSYWHSGFLPGILRKGGTYQASPARVSFLVGSCNHPNYLAFIIIIDSNLESACSLSAMADYSIYMTFFKSVLSLMSLP